MSTFAQPDPAPTADTALPLHTPAFQRLAELETASHLLGQAQAIEDTLPLTLRFVLQTVNRTGGLIFLPTPPNQPPGWITHHHLPASWLAQLAAPESALRHLIQRHLEARPGEVVNAETLPELAAAIAITNARVCVGVLLLCGAPCTAEEIEWLNYLARFVGRAIQRDRLFAAAEDRSQELAALHKIAATLTSTLQLDEILTGTVDGIRQILNVAAASLLLLDEERGELVFKKKLGAGPDWIFQYNPKAGRGLVGEAVRTGLALFVNQAPADPRFNADLDAIPGFDTRSVLCAPLVTRGQRLGAIAVINKRDGPFNLHDQELLESMTASVANAIYNARLFHQLTISNADLEASRWEVLRSRSTLQALFDGITHPIYIVDRDYRLVAVNLACARLARPHLPPAPLAEEAARNALLAHLCYQTLFQRAQPCPGCRMAETLATGQSTQRAECRDERDDEQATDWEISTYPIRDEKGQPLQVIVIGQEVTEKRRLEASLVQSEKLAAVGQLAAGVAHEINNPLAAILANAQLLQRELPLDDDRQESLELIAKAGDRALRVVRNLLDFARQERYEFMPTDVNASLETALELVERQLSTRSITLRRDLAADLPLIPASHDHLQGVWLNLLLNARDAFAGQPGEIRVATRRRGDEIHIQIADNGAGIAPERLARIFEPFYTTKQPGQGTGLGLSLCQRIIKQHDGHIRVESQLGQGTVFTLVLPVKSPLG